MAEKAEEGVLGNRKNIPKNIPERISQKVRRKRTYYYFHNKKGLPTSNVKS